MNDIKVREPHGQASQNAEAPNPVYFGLAHAAKRLPLGRNDRPTHVATLVRWINTGSRGPDGETVRLQAIRMGGRWLTTAEWLEEFGRRLTPTFGANLPVRDSAAGSRSKERTEQELDRIGIR